MHLLGRDKLRSGKESRSSESCPTWSRSHRGARGAFWTWGGTRWSSPWCHCLGTAAWRPSLLKKAFAAPQNGGGGSQPPAVPHSAVSPAGTAACLLTGGCAAAAKGFSCCAFPPSRRHGREK